MLFRSEGNILRTEEDIDKVIKIIKKVHNIGRYHGDLNTSNFIKINDGLKIIDTQMKKEKFWNFKKVYDILTLKEDLLVLELKYEIEKKYILNKKSLSFILANFLKKTKKLKFVEAFRNLKKDLRKKGWKI